MRRSSRSLARRRLRPALLSTAALCVLLAGCAVSPSDAVPPGEPTVTTTPTPTPTPVTPAQRLLLDAGDPAACAVSFIGDGIDLGPALQTSGTRYASLPVPRADGRVFAGWYADDASAAARSVPARINGADVVQCDAHREVTLHGAWMTPQEASAAPARVPILMYHQFTTKPEGEDNWLRLNYYGVEDWRADMTYIRDGGFYLPTWDELDAFVDGALWLPPRSVIITDDDADQTWLDLAVPIVDQLQVLTTSFVITSARTAPTPSMWVQQRSHTHDMHRAGANGKGRMVNDDPATIAADLRTSAEILGAAEVVAYPYGHYDDRSKQGVAEAGFTLAVTTQPGYVEVGADKLALPRVRMDFGMTVDDLRGLIG